MTVVTIEVAPEVVATAEAHVVSFVAVAAQRARPKVAVRPLIAYFRTVAIARSGQEDTVAIGAGYAVTVYAVKGGPLPGAVVA